MLNITHIGHKTTIPGWPEANTIAGLLDALSRWELDPSLNYDGDPRFEPHPDRKPYRCPALKCSGGRYDAKHGRTVYHDGPPIHPDAPDAVQFFGNFVGYSFGFSLETDDRELIKQLDAAIATNLAKFATATA
jgi:hypothetical protein